MRENEKDRGHDPGRDRGPVEYPVRIGRIQHLLAGLQDIVDITPHKFSLNCPEPPDSAPFSGSPHPGCLLRTAPLCIRAFWPARSGFRAVTLITLSGNAPVVMGRLVMKFGG